MEANELQKATQAWQEENPKQRAAFVVFIDSKEDKEHGTLQHQARVSCYGNEEPLKDALKAVLRAGGQSSKGKQMQGLLMKAFLETFVDFINEENCRENEDIRIEESTND